MPSLRALTTFTAVLAVVLLMTGRSRVLHATSTPSRLTDPLDDAEAAEIAEVRARFAATRLERSKGRLPPPSRAALLVPPPRTKEPLALDPSIRPIPLVTPSSIQWQGAGLREELFSRERTLAAVILEAPVGEPVWLTMANSAVADIALNWAAHIFTLGVERRAAIAALDKPFHKRLMLERVPSFNHVQEGFESDVRSSRTGFRKLGMIKARLVLHVLSAGRNVLLSDVDVVWLRLPLPLLLARHPADVMVSTDCLSSAAEEGAATWMGANRCAFLPGNGDGHAAFNTGILYFRASVPALAVAAAWLSL